MPAEAAWAINPLVNSAQHRRRCGDAQAKRRSSQRWPIVEEEGHPNEEVFVVV
jgi:hypothetical protein